MVVGYLIIRKSVPPQKNKLPFIQSRIEVLLCGGFLFKNINFFFNYHKYLFCFCFKCSNPHYIPKLLVIDNNNNYYNNNSIYKIIHSLVANSKNKECSQFFCFVFWGNKIRIHFAALLWGGIWFFVHQQQHAGIHANTAPFNTFRHLK